MVYAKFGEQTECIMGNWKIENGFFAVVVVVAVADVVAEAPYCCPARGRGVGEEGRRRKKYICPNDCRRNLRILMTDESNDR